MGLADIDAFWLGTMGSGVSGITLSKPLKLDYKPVSRLEQLRRERQQAAQSGSGSGNEK